MDPAASDDRRGERPRAPAALRVLVVGVVLLVLPLLLIAAVLPAHGGGCGGG